MTPLNSYSHAGRDFHRDDIVAEFGDTADQPAGRDDLVIALETLEHRLMLAGFFGLRPQDHEVKDRHYHRQRYQRIGNQRVEHRLRAGRASRPRDSFNTSISVPSLMLSPPIVFITVSGVSLIIAGYDCSLSLAHQAGVKVKIMLGQCASRQNFS